MAHRRPAGIPASISKAQFDEYRRLTLKAIRALGINPNVVALNGVTCQPGGQDAVNVEFIVPDPAWDGEGMVPAQVDEWRENEIRKGRATLYVSEVEA